MWQKREKRLNIDRWLVIVIVSYTVLAVLLLPKFQFHLQNDSFAYLSLAATHQSNPYWGPMLPWLISLLSEIGIVPLLSIRLVSVIASVGMLILLSSFKKLLPLQGDVWKTTTVTLAVFLLMKTLDIATPDMLLVAFLALMIRLSIKDSVVAAVGTGLMAGLGYLTKSVALPFFLLFSVFLLGWRIRTEPTKKKQAITSFIISMCACASIAMPWIINISLQNGSFTIGESAHVIHATMTPLHDKEVPMNVRGLLLPPHENSLSIWDDPTTLEYHDWSPLSSRENFIRQLKIIILNASRIAEVLFREFWLAWAILGSSFVFAISRKKNVLSDCSRLSTAIWIILMIMYLPIVIDDRYLWIGVTSILITGALMTQTMIEHHDWKGLQKYLVLLVFFLAFTAYPSWQTLNAIDDGRVRAMDAKMATVSLPMHGSRTASDHWKIGLAFSYFANAHYYGRPKQISNPMALSAELRANEIDFYLVVGSLPDLPGYKEVMMSPKKSIRILQRISDL